MELRSPASLLRYLLGLLLLLFAALMCRILLDPWLGDVLSHPTVFTAVLLTTWYLGTGPAVLNTIVGYPVVEYLIIESPFRDGELGYLLPSLGLYLTLNAIIIFFVNRFRRERDLLKKAQEKLAEGEQRLRAAFDNAALGIVETDGRDRFAAVNERICRMLGYEKNELLGMSVEEITAPEDRPQSNRLNAELHEGKHEKLDYEKRYLKRDGSPVWVHVTVSAIFHENGDYSHSIGTVEDITERKLAEQALQEREHFYRQIVESMPGMVFTAAPDGLWIYQSRQWVDFTGVPMSEHLGAGWESIVHREDRPRVLAAWHAAVNRGAAYDIEYRIRGADGEYHWFKVRGQPVRNQAGEVAQWLGVATDIDALKRAEQALRASERSYRIVADNTYAWEFWTDPDGRYLYVSPSCERWTGYKAHEFLGDPGLMRRIIHPDDIEEYLKHGGDNVSCRSEETTFRIFRRDGALRWIGHTCNLVYDVDGSFLGIRGSNRDITEQKRGEKRLREEQLNAEAARQAAEQANAAKDQFLAVLSHELRSPLSPVLAGIVLLQKRGCTCAPHEELEIIRRNIELEARLIDDLLDITRIEKGKIRLDRRTIGLASLLNRVVETCKPGIEERGLRLLTDFEDGAAELYGDVARLQQIFWNIVNNAVKFTPQGGSIAIRSRREDGKAVVEVQDSGIGIEPESLEKIFSAFEQASADVWRQFGGLGLGLAISRRLAEMHGGTIKARSDGLGRGAVFTVTLPLQRAARHDHIEKTVTNTMIENNKNGVPVRQKRILLVEDHADTAMMMKELLQVSGYEVETTSDVARSLEAIASRDFDLVISDLGLPDRSGLELMKEIRRQRESLKGIALSGYGRDEDIQKSMAAGFSAHLTKPVDFDALLEAVNKVAG